jgi:hypothetical protein
MMSRLSPQVLLQASREIVQREWKWRRTREHAPPIPTGANTDDPVAEPALLDVRLIQELGFRAFRDDQTGASCWPIPLGLTPHELMLFGKSRESCTKSRRAGTSSCSAPSMGRSTYTPGS